VAEYLKDQQEYFLDLTEYCAALSSRLNTGDSSENQKTLNEALDNEVLMDGMGQLQFLSTSMGSHHPIGSGEEREFCGVGDLRPKVDSKKNNDDVYPDVSSRYRQSASHDKENVLATSHRGNEGVIQQSSAEMCQPSVDSRLAAAVHSEAVHQKYVHLLQQMERPLVDRPVSSKSSSKSKNLSSMLPPQQVEPEAFKKAGIDHLYIPKLQGSVAEVAVGSSSPTAQHLTSDVGSSEEGDEQPPNFWSDQRVGQWNQRRCVDARVSRNLEPTELLELNDDDKVVLDNEDYKSSRVESKYDDHRIEPRHSATQQTIKCNSSGSRIDELRQAADGKEKGDITKFSEDDSAFHIQSAFHSDGITESLKPDDKVLPIDMDQIIQRACATRDEALSEGHMHVVKATCDLFHSVSEDIESTIKSHKWKEAMVDQCKEYQGRFDDRSTDTSNALPPTMATLKASIQHMSNRFMLLQREEHSMFEFRDRIATLATQFQNKSISAADGAMVTMLRDRSDIAECRNDIKYAFLWLELHGHFEEIEVNWPVQDIMYFHLYLHIP